MNTKLPFCDPNPALVGTLGRTLGRAPGWALAMSFVVAFTAGACSGKDHGPGASENPSASAFGAGGSNQPESAGNGSGTPIAGVPDAVNRILTLAHQAVDGTFTATHRVRLPNGKEATTMLTQQPPKFGFHVIEGMRRNVVIYDGKVMNGCLRSGKGWQCTQTTSLDEGSPGARLVVGRRAGHHLLRHLEAVLRIVFHRDPHGRLHLERQPAGRRGARVSLLEHQAEALSTN